MKIRGEIVENVELVQNTNAEEDEKLNPNYSQMKMGINDRRNNFSRSRNKMKSSSDNVAALLTTVSQDSRLAIRKSPTRSGDELKSLNNELSYNQNSQGGGNVGKNNVGQIDTENGGENKMQQSIIIGGMKDLISEINEIKEEDSEDSNGS